MNEMIDRVARVVAGGDPASTWEWGSAPHEMRAKDFFYEKARQVIAAIREPTEAMCNAARSIVTDQHPDLTWPAMIDEALR